MLTKPRTHSLIYDYYLFTIIPRDRVGFEMINDITANEAQPSHSQLQNINFPYCEV